MSLRLYMDHHVPASVTRGVRRRGVDVLTAEEDGSKRLADPQLLDRSTELGRALFTQDRHLLAEATLRQRTGRHFAGVIYLHQLRLNIGECIADLALICTVFDPSEFMDHVEYLPLR